MPPTAAELGLLFPELEIGKPLGRGGMGIVYEARQCALDRRVALKLVHAEGATQARRERFEREALALARLNDQHIVALFDVGERGGWFYLVMEFMEGEDLAHLLSHGPLPPRQALDVAMQVAEALLHAHAAGVVHRDIKPANILMGRHGQAKLADFGLAKLLESPSMDLTGAATLLGTPHYMPPEQRRDSWAVDERADLYALGVVLYEMLTGRLPEGRFPLPSRSAGTSPEVDAAVMQAMAAEPRERFQSADEMHAALARAAEENQQNRHRRLTFMMLAVPVIILGATAAWWSMAKRDELDAPYRPRRVAVAKKSTVEKPEVKAALKPGQTQTHAAVLRGDISTLAKLIQNKEQLEAADADGWTPILLAAAQDRSDMMEALHLAGVKHDTMLRGKITALHLAAGRGAVKSAQWLNAHGANLNEADENGWRPLDWAAACLQPDMVRWLIQQGVKLQRGETEPAPCLEMRPLHLAAGAGWWRQAKTTPMPWRVVWQDDGHTQQRCADTVRMLLDLGAPMNDLDDAKLSVLHHAAAANQALAADLLIERGMDVNYFLPPEGLTPLMLAAETNATAAMRVLFEKGSRANALVELESALHKAARAGHVESAALLLKHKADVKRPNTRLATPLHLAAGGGHVEIMKLLLAHGAEVDARDIRRFTPLHEAAVMGKLDAARLLCEHGANPLARDGGGLTAAENASLAGQYGVAKLIASYAATSAAESKK
ncbi:protein kinase domain-containing protein [Prosthecobacter sp.]|uniref:protein kinase domain-containing protein n=1 Tax=Prosthecobacter sp. TaxID=1965333 RepID=UPI0037840DB2